ncbi:hypothetical protein J2857_003592 [Neorhizobium galegae]|uniref:hypothetical protein n=1 Tax=Neorhizobium galegae TaxID=399 RepID=UPI001AE65A12|nr:hypothetical protein [Neorhizobium galegae]MBP2560823.1 hypothetical protein [Neorhizobium galegae]
MAVISSFLILAETYCRAAGIAEATLSSRVFNDGKRIGQLRSGADVGSRRLETATLWLSENWPKGCVWPEDVPRPKPAAEIPEAAE